MCRTLANRNSITERVMTQGRTYNNGSGDTALQGVFLNVPGDDWSQGTYSQVQMAERDAGAVAGAFL